MNSEITIERTGGLYSFSSVEFLATFPDGTQERIWSPPWSDLDYDDPKQDEGALKYALELWEKRNHGS
jgi:hypothetical protein